MENWLNVGKVVNTHGIKGEVRVISITDFTEERYKPGSKLTLFIDGKNPEELTVSSHRSHKSFDLLTFEGLNNVNEVEKMKGGVLRVPNTELGTLNEGEFYYHQIIGCQVLTLDGEEVGKITEVMSPGANDVWVVKVPGKKDVLIPYIDQIVKEVNIEEQKVIIEPMEGLLS